MNKNVLIAFGGATLIALVVAMLLSAMLKGGKDEQPVVQEIPKVEILVASKALGVGQLLAADNIKWKKWPQEATYPGTIQREGQKTPLEALKGRTIRPFIAEEPIVSSGVVSSDGGFLAAALEPGYRAVAVSVGASTMAGGFINPADYVDVLMTYQVSIPVNSSDESVHSDMQRMLDENVNRYATETILQNVKVLGVDQRTTKEEESAAKVGKTVTLQVTEREAQILALATQMGDLSLALRSLGDDKISKGEDPVVSDARIVRMNKELTEKMNAVMETSGARQHNVRIYNGGNVTNLPTR